MLLALSVAAMKNLSGISEASTVRKKNFGIFSFFFFFLTTDSCGILYI